MHSITDWVSLHDITCDDVQDILQAYAANALMTEPGHWRFGPQPDAHAPGDQRLCFDGIVRPALAACLDPDDQKGLDKALEQLTFVPLDTTGSDHPFTTYTPEAGPVIAMTWSDTPADLLCLAHEAGHAAHYILSQTNLMPPILRETCAFLAELVVIDAVGQSDPGQHTALQLAWHEDANQYLDDDLPALAEALKDPATPYHYRMNYPIARLAAVRLFEQVKATEGLHALFESGADGMARLGLDALAKLGDALDNYLPQFFTATGIGQSGYQSLGAMILLDIDSYKGASEDSIGQVYERLLQHLQTQTAFLALRPDHRPIGYATWSQPEADRAVTLTHQTAPFGDHLALQRSLRDRLEGETPITVQTPRSARQEQVAW